MTKTLAGVTPGIKTNTTLERSWEALPGYILIFPVCIALSGKMSAEREQTIGASNEERADLLLDFRVRLLGDVLEDAPRMLSITKATDLLEEKQDKELWKILEPTGFKKGQDLPKPAYDEAFKRSQAIRLTEDELEGIYEYFPNWQELTEGAATLSEAAALYFGQKDSKGRVTFQILVENIIADYWAWATPRPTISVSAFLPNKQAISTTN